MGILSKIRLLIALFLFSSVDLNSFALDNYYLRFDSGLSSVRRNTGVNFKRQYVAGVGLGYAFNDIFSLDLNLQYRPIKTKSSMLRGSNYTSFLNGYFNLMDRDFDLVLYLTGGLGLSHNQLKSYSNTHTKNSQTINVSLEKTSKNNLAWNIGIGAKHRIGERAWLNLTYRYLDLGELRIKSLNLTGSNKSLNIPAQNIKLKGFEVTSGLSIDL